MISMIRSVTMTYSEALQSLLDSPFTALVFILGACGWWRLIARDSLFDTVRHALFVRFPHEGFVSGQVRPRRGIAVYSGGAWYTTKGVWLGELIYCPYCLTWWIAIAQFVVYMLAPKFVLGLALMHVARIVSGLLTKHS